MAADQEQNGVGDEANLRQLSDTAKDEGNAAFKAADYSGAIESYSSAIHLFPTAVLYANRSIAYLRTECVGYALNDASKAIELDGNYVKGYYRRAAVIFSFITF